MVVASFQSVGTYIRRFGTQMPFWGGAIHLINAQKIPLRPARPISYARFAVSRPNGYLE